MRCLIVGKPEVHFNSSPISLIVRFLKYVHFTVWCRAISFPPRYLHIHELFTLTKKFPLVLESVVGGSAHEGPVLSVREFPSFVDECRACGVVFSVDAIF